MKMSNVRSVLRRRSKSSIRSGVSTAAFSGGAGESDMMVDVLAVEMPVAPEDRRLSLHWERVNLQSGGNGKLFSSDSPGQGAIERCAVVAGPLRSGRTLSRPSETRILRIACPVSRRRLLLRHIDVQARR